MKLVRYSFKPESPLGTPLQSDTLAGHLLCYLRERSGDAALEEVLGQFEAGNPPFIVSSAFPSGMLPRPEMPPMSREALGVTRRFLEYHLKRRLDSMALLDA